MPLSDREQRILSDIESRLREEDPKLARTVSTADVSSGTRWKVKLSLAGLIVGFLLLLAVVPAGTIWIGVAGFVLMLASVMFGGHQLKRLGSDGGDLTGQLRGGLNRYLSDRRRGQQDDDAAEA